MVISIHLANQIVHACTTLVPNLIIWVVRSLTIARQEGDWSGKLIHHKL